MKEFVLLFRRDASEDEKLSPEELQKMTQPWAEWMQGIIDQGKLANRGNRLHSTGRVVNPDRLVTDGPYVEIKEALGGYIVVQATDLDEAAELAKGCPILGRGGNVEVREIATLSNPV